MNHLLMTFLLVLASVANAQSLDKVRLTLASQLYEQRANEVHHDQPQPLLRAVVVLRVRLDDAGHWCAEVLRENNLEPAMTRKAIQSLTDLPAPAELTEEESIQLKHIGFVEAWLFQKDGRYALKTLAKPQRGV